MEEVREEGEKKAFRLKSGEMRKLLESQEEDTGLG